MRMNIFTILLFSSLVSNLISLKIFKSHNVNSDKEIVRGLHYKKQSEKDITFSNSLTFCIRLNIRRLHNDNFAKLLIIQNTEYEFFRLNARYPETWLKFGNSNKGNGFKGSWILYDPLENDYLTWRLNKWHHICFSYSKQASHISLVRVRFR